MFHMKLRAVIQCDHEWKRKNGSDWGCTRTEYYEVFAEEMSLAEFAKHSQRHFESRGWQLYGGVKCSECKEVRQGQDDD